jgi:hypothetical protein
MRLGLKMRLGLDPNVYLHQTQTVKYCQYNIVQLPTVPILNIADVWLKKITKSAQEILYYYPLINTTLILYFLG